MGCCLRRSSAATVWPSCAKHSREAESEIEGGVSPRVAPFADVRELGALLQRAGFALPVVDSDRLTVRYATVFALMRDLRRMGATNVLSERRRTPLKRATLTKMAEIYARRFADADGRLRATFEIAWLSGWAPHESQQKPLKPGAAAQRLADALGAKELPAGDKGRRRRATEFHLAVCGASSIAALSSCLRPSAISTSAMMNIGPMKA